MLIMLLNLKGNVMFQKIYTEEDAQQFVDFVQKEFKTIPPLMEWLKPVSERLGIVHMTHHSIDFGKIKQHYLFLSIDSNKSIILGDINLNAMIMLSLVPLILLMNKNPI